MGRKVTIPYLRVLSPSELGYIAAMFDGEGTLGVYRVNNKENNYSPTALVVNTSETLLEYLKRTTQVGQVKPRGRPSPRSKEAFYWILNNRDIGYLIPLILPHLVIKQRQAEIVLEYLEHCCGTRNTQPTGAMLYHRQALYEETMALNKRGS